MNEEDLIRLALSPVVGYTGFWLVIFDALFLHRARVDDLRILGRIMAWGAPPLALGLCLIFPNARHVDIACIVAGLLAAFVHFSLTSDARLDRWVEWRRRKWRKWQGR